MIPLELRKRRIEAAVLGQVSQRLLHLNVCTQLAGIHLIRQDLDYFNVAVWKPDQ